VLIFKVVFLPGAELFWVWLIEPGAAPEAESMAFGKKENTTSIVTAKTEKANPLLLWITLGKGAAPGDPALIFNYLTIST
jgi:hypothetical protein